MAWETWVQSQVESYQRLWKWYLMPPCLKLSIIRYGSRVKWVKPGKGVAPSPIPWCSSYQKGSHRVTLDYGRQLYFFLIFLIFLIFLFYITLLQLLQYLYYSGLEELDFFFFCLPCAVFCLTWPMFSFFLSFSSFFSSITIFKMGYIKICVASCGTLGFLKTLIEKHYLKK